MPRAPESAGAGNGKHQKKAATKAEINFCESVLPPARKAGASSRAPYMRLFGLDRDIGGSLGHLIHDPSKIFQAGGRNDDVITAAIDIFGDAQKTTAGIFLQSEDKRLALDLDFFRL